MSSENVQKFLERLKSDVEFRTQFSKLRDLESKDAFIQKAGFTFNYEDLQAVTDEISESQLDAVAGGSCSEYCDGKTCGTYGNCNCVSVGQGCPLKDL